jgi:hypothetical protein
MDQFRFSVRNALLATLWAAVWLATVAAREEWMDSIQWDGLLAHLCVLVYFTTPCLAVGTLFGHPGIGLLCGLVSAGTMIAWSLQMRR